MTKERFYVGDVVDIVSHAEVEDDLCIDEYVWMQEQAINPRIIKYVSIDPKTGDVDHYEIEMSSGGVSYCWPPDAFVLHVEPTIAEVGDLL